MEWRQPSHCCIRRKALHIHDIRLYIIHDSPPLRKRGARNRGMVVVWGGYAISHGTHGYGIYFRTHAFLICLAEIPFGGMRGPLSRSPPRGSSVEANAINAAQRLGDDKKWRFQKISPTKFPAAQSVSAWRRKRTCTFPTPCPPIWTQSSGTPGYCWNRRGR